MREARPPCEAAPPWAAAPPAVKARAAAEGKKAVWMAWRFMMVPPWRRPARPLSQRLCQRNATHYFAHSVRLRVGSQMQIGAPDMTVNIRLGLLLVGALICVMRPAAAAPVSISAVASIGEMQGLNGAANPVVQVLSYYPGLNRGGGLFIWNAASGDAPDGCTIFAPQKQAAGQKGRWTRQLSGALDASMCGAYWDNSHDDAAALTRAFAAASRLHLALNLPGGGASVCSSVTAAAGVVVHGQGMGGDATILDGSCMKSGWVFDINTPN